MFNCFAMLCSFLLCRKLSQIYTYTHTHTHTYIYPLPHKPPSHFLVIETLIASQKMCYCWASFREIEQHTPVFFTLFPEEMVYSLPINLDVLFCWAMGGTPPLPSEGRETVTWGQPGEQSRNESSVRLDAGCRMLGAGALGWPRGMVRGGRWEGGSGWGTRVHPWQIHVDIWQNQYNIVK